MPAISTENHPRAVLAGGEFYVWHAVRVDESQEDGFRIADAAVWHFEIRLSRHDFQFCTYASLVVDQFERAASNYRDGALGAIRLCTNNLHGDDSEVQEEKDQEHAIRFHGSLDADALCKVAFAGSIRPKPDKARQPTTFAVTSRAIKCFAEGKTSTVRLTAA